MKTEAAGEALSVGTYAGCTDQNNLITFLERHRAACPERAALRWVEPAALEGWSGTAAEALPHQQMTYGELAANIEHVAAALQRFGLRRGDRCIVFLPMGPLMYMAMFAVQRIGAAAVFLDSWARRHHLGASAACVTPVAMISHKAAFDLVADIPELSGLPIRIVAGPGEDTGFTARLESLFQEDGRVPVQAVDAGETALITFTTGSSGVPKGANRTHRFLCAQHRALSSLLPYAPGDEDLPAFPIFSLNNLACGVTTVVPALDLARPGPRDAALLVAQMQQPAVTCATLSPSMLVGVTRYCAKAGIRLEGIRRVVTGGAPISRDNVREFLAIAPETECMVLYGSTEVEPMAHIRGRDMLNLPEPSDPELIEEGVNVGRICPDLEVRFLRIREGAIELEQEDWDELEVPRGSVGELVVTGEYVCRDYYNNPEAFRRAKIVDHDGRVWHRTGDLARLDAAGYLWVVGRVHNVIERAGCYCFPVRAEILLKRVSFVQQGAYLGLPDSSLGERAVAAVVLEPGTGRETAEAEIRRLFGKNDIPLDAVYVVEAIPMDPRHHSKVEYEQLRQMLRPANGSNA